MVAINIVNASNAQISKSLPADLVAVVTGGTSGIGEATINELVKHAVRPKIYIVGRSQESADRIISHCQSINPDGKYFFIQKSFGLLKSIAELVEEIMSKEKKINILIHSAGGPDLDKASEFSRLLRSLKTYVESGLLYTVDTNLSNLF
jgi:NADP-dependent 3-hydroxy acid dehydrogenase YdfG